MPAENDPAEPNALTQSLQLTCSLTPSSTLPSTRLVIIWLKRCPARSLIEPAFEPAIGVVLEVGEALGVGDGEGVGLGVGLGLGLGEGDCARVGDCAASSESARTADATRLRMKLAIVSGRTACRWGRCRHR